MEALAGNIFQKSLHVKSSHAQASCASSVQYGRPIVGLFINARPGFNIIINVHIVRIVANYNNRKKIMKDVPTNETGYHLTMKAYTTSLSILHNGAGTILRVHTPCSTGLF